MSETIVDICSSMLETTPEASVPSPRRISDRTIVAILIILGAFWTYAFLQYKGMTVHHEIFEEELIAEHVDRGEGFASPMDMTSHAPPTAYSSPLWPMLAAGVYELFGELSTTSQIILTAFNALAVGATVAAVFVIGHDLMSRNTGLIAAALLMLYPPIMKQAGFMWDRSIAIAIFFWLVVVVMSIRKNPTVLKIGLLGAGMGLLALDNASFVFTYPLLVLLAAKTDSLGRRIAMVGASLLGFVLVLTPWTIRNYEDFHKLFFIRANYPLELWHGNYEMSTGEQTRLDLLDHPFNNAHEREIFNRVGEMSYYDLCLQRFKQIYSADPAGFWLKTRNRVFYLLVGDVDQAKSNGTLLALGIAGFWTAWRLRVRALWLLGLGLLSGAPFLATHVSHGYALALRTVLIVGVAMLLTLLWKRLESGYWRYEPAR